ncbi:class I SAM-dependent methyltransferase [Streptomyces sp. NPDC050617]|uniref:class I SAM-dependent methyltransferase n=1 Tax=Streptomyces sp. NPDC050617 TaxID=3154628 RepID=UPI0034153F84
MRAPPCFRFPLSADLRDPWTPLLRVAGFARDRPAVWVAEGLLYYLGPDAQQDPLQAVDENSAPGSRWVIEDDPCFLKRMEDPQARARSESLGLDRARCLTRKPGRAPARGCASTAGPWSRGSHAPWPGSTAGC